MTASCKIRQALLLGAVLLALGTARPAFGGELSPALLEAMEAARMDRITVAQRAMLFANNDAINRARLNGWITDAHYQAAQADFKLLNEELAGRAARDVGGKFGVQVPKKGGFSPGTDSDYIIKIVSSDPVGKVREMQIRYNAYVNKFLNEALKGEGIRVTHRLDWHNQLDVDFMVDPKYVSDRQFKEIAELNNDAYKRRLAADYERVSRAKAPEHVTNAHFREYTEEMLDFIAKKQKKMAELRSQPGKLANPDVAAELHRWMAQEQKYIDRIEAANVVLRKQERLPMAKLPYSEPHYEITRNARGEPVLRYRTSESLAARGSVRSPSGFRMTATASSLAPLSTQRALRTLAESMVEASVRNSRAWPSQDVAKITRSLPAAEKARLIESLRRKYGDRLAADVAENMRKEAGPAARPGSRLDQSLRNALGISDDLRHMSQMRRSFNELAARQLKLLNRLKLVGDVVLLAQTITDMKTYYQSISVALDPNISDEEAEKLFQRADAAAWSMATNGALGTLFARVPTLGAAYGAWTVGYDGTRFVLENTELGQRIDRKAFEYADRFTRSYEKAADRLSEMLGGSSERLAGKERLQALEQRYLKLIKEGRLKLKPDVTGAEVLARIRSGDLWGLDELLEPAGIGGPEVRPNSEYMVWSNDVGWVHVGTVRQFHAVRSYRSETWGGTSSDPLRKLPMLGGRHFSSQEEAMQTLSAQIGSQLTRCRAPLAFPKVYYMAGKQRVGFEIVNHPVFKAHKARADAGK